MKRSMILALILLPLFVFPSPSHAVPITFSYEGIVNVGDGYPDSAPFAAFPGETIRMVYTFESTTPDSNASSNGDYLGAVTSVQLFLSSNIYTATSGNIILIDNGFNPDQYIVDIVGIPGGLIGPTVGGMPLVRLELILSDNTHTALANDLLPTIQPDPSDYSDAVLQLQFRNPDNPFPFENGIVIASGTVGISPVPEPSTVLLLGSGLVGLMYHRRRRHQTR